MTSVAYSPDGKTLASGGSELAGESGVETYEIELWDVATGKEQATLKGHTGPVGSVAFSPDGKTLASVGYEEIKLWDVATGKEQATLLGSSVAFSPDGKTLALGVESFPGGEIGLWDLATGTKPAAFKNATDPKEVSAVTSVAFSPDGKTLASGNTDGTVTLLDVATGKVLATLKGHTQRVRSVAFSPDGKTLASGSDDQTVKLWDIPARHFFPFY